MKGKRYSEEQIIHILRKATGSQTVPAVCARHNVSEATLYGWKKKYGGLGVAELGRLRQLEEENQRLKKLVADLSLEKHSPVLAKESLKPARRCELAGWLQATFEVSQRRACGLAQVQRSTCRYRSHGPDQTALTMRLKELAAVRVRFGYRRLTILLQREGRAVGKRRVYRLYRQENLLVRVFPGNGPHVGGDAFTDLVGEPADD